MKKLEINQKVSEGYLLTVCLTPDKQYTKLILKAYLTKPDSSIVYPVYYNHCKGLLSVDQITFINTYNKVKNFSFSDKVELNVKSKQNNLTKEDMQSLVILQALTKKEYIEQK